ncbi:hypothetical protein HUK80_17765 [Flavobacterium sp. MAH-1]|uniref:DUF3887 domain-containing protein n=2 Tax=Flavobacterium agri TaxID=2743471 RepID=A0A7Y8Y6E8_9FLAO|nr:hypothetical protein [Flavobacterium agri]NYA72778.1 hypothetical protein [Flavobacterium agri]
MKSPKNFYLTILLFVFAISFSQVKEEIIDSDGKKIETNKSNDYLLKKSAHEIADLFYLNQNDVNKIDPLISIYFYKKTPYYKLKEILIEKNKSFGKFKSKKLIETFKKDDLKAIKFTFEVTYEKLKTTEELILVKEHSNNPYQVFEYNIKKG